MNRMLANRLRVSLVIPAYNEENHLQACLQAACNQTIPFYEIIVVDNNSMDRTAAIAKSFPGVIVIPEPKQGKVHARTAGFDAARGDIIGRIDADTVLPPDWAANLQRVFSDGKTDAVSGRPAYYDLPFPGICNAIEGGFRRLLAYELRDTLFLQGANMAVKRSAWQAVKSALCASDRHIHEDFDIAIHLQAQGFKVTYDERLVAGLSARAVDVSLPFFISYVRMNTYTYAVHQVPHYRRMYPVIAIIFVLFFPARALFRGRDPHTGKFSWSRLFASHPVNPRVKSAASSVYLS
jgi:glycosyltransferase involved in cell wall biosynthesis